MWSSLLLAGLLGGWWGIIALAASPPASLPVTRDDNDWKRTATSPITYADDYYYKKTMIFGFEPAASASRRENLRFHDRAYQNDEGGAGVVDKRIERITELQFQSRQMGLRNRLRHRRQIEILARSGKPIRRDDERAIINDVTRETREPIDVPKEQQLQHQPLADDNFVPIYANESTVIEGPKLLLADYYGSIDRPRIARSPKQQQKQHLHHQRPRNRTRSESPREQRRRCRIRGNCRGRNWCPDMDVANRAYLAPTVFEGKARSMSSLRKPGSNYAVTFEVKQVYKSQPGFLPLQKNDSVRLHFRDKTVPGKSTLCGSQNAGQQQQQQQQQQQKERDNLSAGVVRANIKRGKVYLVFVNRVGPRNFTILGEPVIRSKKNEQAVQAVIRPDYVREVTLSELRDSVARYRDRVKLVCRTRGSPPPRVHWLKDGVPLQPRRGLRIQHKRRRSKVVISSARPEDSGRYECVAESTSGHRASLAAQLLVAHDTRIPETTTAAWLRQEQPCPIAGDFCMNGGTCLFFETVGEPACRCAEGFTGLRCETKDVISTGNMDKFSSFTEDLALARF